jgi:hypothetical protein
MDITEPSLIVIIDINCPLGASVAEKFLSLKDWRVRAVTDDETEEDVAQLAEWEARGIEVVRADFHDPCQLAMAFDMADAIFCATNYWKLLQDHSAITYTFLTKMHPRRPVCQLEINRNVNVIQAASMTPTLQRFVMAIDPSPIQLSHGTVESAYHMNGKWYAMGELKKSYPDLAQKTSILLIGRSMDRFRDHVIRQVSLVQYLHSQEESTQGFNRKMEPS